MTTPEPTSQSEAARRSAEAEIRALIDKFAPDALRLVGTVRGKLRKLLPTAHEVVYEYRDWTVISWSPSDRGYEGVFAIRADADGVKLYFNSGKTLPDPDKLLRGSAKLVRWIDLKSAAVLNRPAVARLITEAIARTPTPFAPTGGGSITIRSASAKKPRARKSA